MRELARSNEPVFVSWIVAALADSGIEALVFDQHTSIVEGSIGILPRRIMVLDEDFDRARQILEQAPDLSVDGAMAGDEATTNSAVGPNRSKPV